jgi:uncharacterized protein YwqG
MSSPAKTPESTEEDMKLTREKIRLEYGVSLPKKELPGFIKKVWELYRWAQTEIEDFSGSVTDEMAEKYRKTFKDKHGKDISKSEAFRQLQGVTAFTIYKERLRLSNEMRAVVVKYKKVDYNSDILEKLKKLLASYYKIDLNESELKKILRQISKYIWQHVGLIKSVESCFDDMIKFDDRDNRGKSLAGLDNHKDVKAVLDTILHDLKKH